MPPARGDGLLTTSEAARLVGRAPGTVYSWATRGHISPDGLDERNRPLYRRETVREAERKVRGNGLKASGIDPRKLCHPASRAA